jgi:alginate O-acetyltransferase complex protein AlgI
LTLLLLALSTPLGQDKKKRLLAVASCVFYAAWDYRYLALLLVVSVIDYWCALRIFHTEEPRARKRYLLISIVSNLGILGYFKYTNFFLETVHTLVPGWHGLHLDILLPAGISFYVFKSMSYTIDVHRREIEPCLKVIDYVTFISFFPDLIAGPIVRASVFLPQMSRPIGPSWRRLVEGGSLFLSGLTKKLVIADTLARVADPVFDAPERYATVSLWVGVLAYSIQIYCDFAGYSDMAIGTAKMIGYDLPENFRMPYISRNPSEFWRRWHITLSEWLRDYLYIPLGGNRHGQRRTYLNLAITMLLGGLWHGASWTFVLWGALHGAALCVHRKWRELRLPLPSPTVSRLAMFLFVTLCWVPFRAPDIHAAAVILKGLFGAATGNVVYVSALLPLMAGLVVLGHVLLLAVESERYAAFVASLLRFFDVEVVRNPTSGVYPVLRSATVGGAFLTTAWFLLAVSLASFGSRPFIYFQF